MNARVMCFVTCHDKHVNKLILAHTYTRTTTYTRVTVNEETTRQRTKIAKKCVCRVSRILLTLLHLEDALVRVDEIVDLIGELQSQGLQTARLAAMHNDSLCRVVQRCLSL